MLSRNIHGGQYVEKNDIVVYMCSAKEGKHPLAFHGQSKLPVELGSKFREWQEGSGLQDPSRILPSGVDSRQANQRPTRTQSHRM